MRTKKGLRGVTTVALALGATVAPVSGASATLLSQEGVQFLGSGKQVRTNILETSSPDVYAGNKEASKTEQ